MKKYYVGQNIKENRRDVIFTDTPNEKTWGSLYNVLTGPFKTKRGALYCKENPFSLCSCVQEYEFQAFLNSIPFDPSKDVWRCLHCTKINVWAYCDLEKLVKTWGIHESNIYIATGSCFDNICGHCRTNFVKSNSPILAECYTH